ncbi:MAG: sigma-70 family RNA polymerase sigma factor [Mucilaginibacter sp.]|uniref:RNA polymerase sigma factor n=1 Tax=Mucilaginibacter sp. TaxID=1882438 RepID=UPI0032638700
MQSKPINTKQSREELFTTLYQKAFPIVAKYVAKMGGSFDQAKDIFQDALVIYYEKVLSNSVTLQSSDKAYILGIAKHLWLKTYRDNAGNIPLDVANVDQPQEEQHQYASNKLMHYLETTGQKCMEVLKAFYYDKLPLTQITQLFGYSGTHSATVQKYKCLEKVRDTVKQKSLHYEDFLE